MNSQASGSDKVSSAFDLLAEPVRRWIWRKGWTGLRDIQERAIPALVQGDDDLIISAATAAVAPTMTQVVVRASSFRIRSLTLGPSTHSGWALRPNPGENGESPGPKPRALHVRITCSGWTR